MNSAASGPAEFQKAIALYEAGRAAEAEAACRAILKARPREAPARHLLGVLCLQAGRLDDAVAALGRAAKEMPKHPPLLHALGVALQTGGRGREAAQRYRAALALDPNMADTRNNLGLLLLEQGRAAEAAAMLEEAVKARPGYRDALYNLGRARWALGAPDDAALCFEQALAASPGDISCLTRLGDLHMAGRDYPASEAAWRRLLEVEPDNVAAQLNIARARRAAGDLEAALAVTTEMLAAPDALMNAHVLHADLLTALGRLDEAKMHYARAIDAPRAPGADVAPLARALAQAGGDDAPARLEALLREPGLSAKSEADVHLAIGRLADRRRDYERAIGHFKTGNAIKSRALGFDPKAQAESTDAAIATFDSALFAARAGWGDPDERPVFIVGMPRSGTTLAEQILASHPAVFGAGELEEMGALPMEIIRRTGSNALFPECVRDLTPDVARDIAADHLAALARHAGGDGPRRIIDKNPYNFYMLGLIALLFPNARIIHCRRDPLDTCLSCFFTNFDVEAAFARDLAHLGVFYRDYDRLMAHWRSVLPLPVLDVHYEDTVADLEGVSRRMVDFLGLDWDDACLNFWQTERVVRTASSQQVRRPIYTSSVRRADAYRPWLGPLIEALGDLAT